MSGKKGHSGRYPRLAQDLRTRVIQKAWNKVDYKLDKGDPQAYTIASNVVVKDMVGKENIDMTATITQKDKALLDRLAAMPINRLSTMNVATPDDKTATQ